MLKTKNIISYQGTLAEKLLEGAEYPWQALPLINQYILDLGPGLPKSEYEQIKDDIWIHHTAQITESALLNGPLIIGPDCEIRHNAFIRGNVIIGNSCIVGNSTELKNSILVSHVEAPHFNYVGDSILAPYSHMGAGSITSNIKADRKNIILYYKNQQIETGLRKFGAILGDHVEVGCNAVLNPGVIIGKNTIIYPLSMVRGIIESNIIYKNQNDIVELK
ncbi:MAG TPA: UDP-N-acetylglucosamine pyrophosphorylase [Clostridiaceae bacterium]|nr:UDP-N-acetylglucosamine pyrophosphorylase [Clostridiaceae bacterium]